MPMVKRDAFARTELHRELKATSEKCYWCGGDRGSGKLYEYRTEHDGGRKETHSGVFCDRACFSSYHCL